MVREPVRQRRDHPHITKHLCLFGKAKIGGAQHTGVLVQFRKQVKQLGTTGLTKGQIAQLVEHHQVDLYWFEGDLVGFSSRLLSL